MPNAFVKIADHVFDGATPSITFRDIPQHYQELWVIWSLRSARSGATIDQVQFYANGNQSNTDYTQIGAGFLSSGSSTTLASGTFYNAGSGWYGCTIAADGMVANLFGHGLVKFWNYNVSNQYKIATLLTTTVNNSLASANMYNQEQGIHAQVLEPIRELNFKAISGTNFKAYSAITLYGVG
jgi:hypothetical protein